MKQKKPRTDTELRLFCISFKGVSKTALYRELGIPKMSFFNWWWGCRSGKDYTPTLASQHEAALLEWALSVGFVPSNTDLMLEEIGKNIFGANNHSVSETAKDAVFNCQVLIGVHDSLLDSLSLVIEKAKKHNLKD